MSDQVWYYRWHNNPMRERLYGRPCRVFARGTKNSVGLEFLDGREPRKTVTSRYAIQAAPPRARTEALL